MAGKSLVNNEQFLWQIGKFRSFRTKQASMRKIQEEDKFSGLKHVVCSLMNMSNCFV
jgi:hypothetical protein